MSFPLVGNLFLTILDKPEGFRTSRNDGKIVKMFSSDKSNDRIKDINEGTRG
jgi:hypothetical protein